MLPVSPGLDAALPPSGLPSPLQNAPAADVHMHVRSRKPLQDVLTATRLRMPITACGLKLRQNAEQHLRTRRRIAERCPPELMLETLRVADRCDFSLDELKYQYPDEVVPDSETPQSYLRRIVYEGAGRRWPMGVPAQAQTQIEHELALIAELQYEHYFLTVYDIVAFARSKGILCQGRGSAANSVVCYCAGVTEVDLHLERADGVGPADHVVGDLVFGRDVLHLHHVAPALADQVQRLAQHGQ